MPLAFHMQIQRPWLSSILITHPHTNLLSLNRKLHHTGHHSRCIILQSALAFLSSLPHIQPLLQSFLHRPGLTAVYHGWSDYRHENFSHRFCLYRSCRAILILTLFSSSSVWLHSYALFSVLAFRFPVIPLCRDRRTSPIASSSVCWPWALRVTVQTDVYQQENKSKRFDSNEFSPSRNHHW